MQEKPEKNDVGPAVAAYTRAGNEFSFFIHDHVTNSSDLFDEKLMDSVFGRKKMVATLSKNLPRISRQNVFCFSNRQALRIRAPCQ